MPCKQPHVESILAVDYNLAMNKDHCFATSNLSKSRDSQELSLSGTGRSRLWIMVDEKNIARVGFAESPYFPYEYWYQKV